MEWESDSPCHSHIHPGQGHRFPRRHSGWELECSDCGTISTRGLLLAAERWTEATRGRRLWWVWGNSRRQWRTGKPGVLHAVHGVTESIHLGNWTTATKCPKVRLTHILCLIQVAQRIWRTKTVLALGSSRPRRKGRDINESVQSEARGTELRPESVFLSVVENKNRLRRGHVTCSCILLGHYIFIV